MKFTQQVFGESSTDYTVRYGDLEDPRILARVEHLLREEGYELVPQATSRLGLSFLNAITGYWDENCALSTASSGTNTICRRPLLRRGSDSSST